MRTYYDVLGVAADTPDVVIKAAFRALAKEYHPDRAEARTGDTDKFIEIQNAYTVLSKPGSRSEYDAELRESFLYSAPPANAGFGEAGALAPIPWPSAGHTTSDIERICARLGLYSEALAQSFHEAYLRGECGEEPWRFAEEMERAFFRQYFGEDQDLQSLARLLLLGSHMAAAATLNQLVSGGQSSPVRDVRSILPLILDQHFRNEALFTEWLQVKFGIAPAAGRPAMDAVSVEVPPSGVTSPPETSAVPADVPAQPRPLRSAAQVFLWALALYFALFAALPMMQ